MVLESVSIISHSYSDLVQRMRRPWNVGSCEEVFHEAVLLMDACVVHSRPRPESVGMRKRHWDE